MHLRAATRDDVPAILDIYNEAILNSIGTADYDPVSLSARLSWYDGLVEGGYPILVCEEMGECLGYAALAPWVRRTGYRPTAENAVYVAPSARGRGVGHRLLEALIEAGRDAGFRSIIARIATDNEASLRLHRQFAFAEVGHLPQVFVKFDRWYDVVLLQLLL
ncbi:GNAT family N-acetyltransferase [Fimbriimonas ginsengisoli]|uniref:Putative acetyltransferase n=1 Tax=Fimbriimonas ginsengisoli Gsoil 348 TaxID=661478 RepID=A0A068NRI2_FIMGI|nr:GNAT family N-acetyltransferase [Fimbriimonas ginsengisoli]AIE86133.1 putative acetyltransferase [Fimbriimonas ginsengisoli Gsoil 348]